MIGLHFQETYIGMKLAGLYLTILIFQIFEPKNMKCYIRSWKYTQDMLKINLSLKNSTSNRTKYFVTKNFIES